MTSNEAITTLRLMMATQQDVREALITLLDEHARMFATLKWYADRNNYIDGTPMGIGEDNLLSLPDEGSRARQALQLEDIPLGLLIRQQPRETIEIN